MDLAFLYQQLQAGALELVRQQGRELLASRPEARSDICHLLALTEIQAGHPEQAGGWLQQAADSTPGQPQRVIAWANWLELAGQQEAAMAQYRRALVLAPGHGEAGWRLGRLCLLTQRMDEGLALLSSVVEQDPHHGDAHLWLAKTFLEQQLELEGHVHLRIYRHLRPDTRIEDPEPILDTLFFDPEEALATARRRQSVDGIHIRCGFPGIQLCYALAAPVADAPGNLILIPPHGVADHFLTSRLRPPARMVFHPGDPHQCHQAWQLARAIRTWRRQREEYGLAQIVTQARQPLPPGSPLRVLLLSSRADRDSRFFAESLAQAFRELGVHAQSLFEDLQRERYTTLDWVACFQTFQPHLVVSINQLLNYWFHPDTINVIWWQDPVGQLCRNETLPLRPRDLHFSVSRELDPYLLRAGVPAERILRQGFCVDRTVFRPLDMTRQRKVVFVGSSYANKGLVAEALASADGRRLIGALQEILEAGEPLSADLAPPLARKYGYGEHAVFWFFIHYVVRDGIVRWLCQCADLLPVEIHGSPLWQQDPLVAPHYKGLAHRGQPVAALYNQAQYALVCHPFDLHSERLMEVSACGTMPVIYDCRAWSEPPHWDEHGLWFRTRQELRQALTGDNRSPRDPGDICRNGDMLAFARTIMQEVSRRWPIPPS